MIIYICGKITGLPLEEAKQKFNLQAEYIKGIGHLPINPMDLPHNHDKTWESYMRECIVALMSCDALFVLDDAYDSPGAQIELQLAKRLKMQILY